MEECREKAGDAEALQAVIRTPTRLCPCRRKGTWSLMRRPYFFLRFIWAITRLTMLSICFFSSGERPSFRISRMRDVSSGEKRMPSLFAEEMRAIMAAARLFPLLPEGKTF